MTRVLLIGGGGQLGREVQLQAPAGWAIAAPGHGKLDLLDRAAVDAAVAAERPGLVLNFAAFHDLALCETTPDRAFAVNADAVGALAATCRDAGARMITVSTDYVFDGNARMPYREDDEARPLQAYGRSKLAGERAALAAHPDGAFVIRTCGLYGTGGSRSRGGNFIDKRLAEAQGKGAIEVGDDLVCTPTAAADCAAALIGLARADAAPGVYHLTNTGECSWAAFTKAGFELAGADAQVRPVDRKGDYGAVRRPPYSVLDTAKAGRYGIRLRHWRDALADYLKRRQA